MESLSQALHTLNQILYLNIWSYTGIDNDKTVESLKSEWVGIDNNYHFFNELFPAAPIVGGVLVFIIAAVVAVLVIAVMIYWLKRCIKYILKCGLIISVHGYIHMQES